MKKDRRVHERLHMVRPIDGWFSDYAVRVLDLSTAGARIESNEEIPVGARGLFRFFWRKEAIEVTAEIARSDNEQEGLKFTEESGVVRRLISEANAEVRRAQAANALGLREQNVIDGDQTLTAASAAQRSMMVKGFIVWRWNGIAWDSSKALLPDQPTDGFTVAAAESPEQVQQLRQSYEAGDEEGRNLIRRLAELSVAKSR
ncbi:MAG: PilZ domain-containing protein [Thermoanaerobaculia bacterium]